MIQHILSELAPEEKTTEVQGVVEEEGSSPTPKKNAEDVKAVVEDRTTVTPSTQSEIPSITSKKPDPVDVEKAHRRKASRRRLP